jgi:type 1 glutamine amidotransferase
VNVLVVRGGWSGHEPAATTSVFLPLFAGATVQIAETLDVYEDRAALDAADLIVQCWTGGRLTAAQEAGLVERVERGAGFAGWHGGVLATAYEAARYQFMVGGRFLCHPGDFVGYRVDIVGGHPLATGLAPFDVHTEQYYCHVDPGLSVLATTTFEGRHGAAATAGVVMPVAWTRRFGAGRVFVSSLGHCRADLELPPVRTLTERGLLWAAGLA